MEPKVPPVVTYLRSLEAVRDRCEQVFALLEKGKLDHWDYHPDKLDFVADYCVGLIQRDYKDLSIIPPTSRRTHFSPPPTPRIQIVLTHPSLSTSADPLARAISLIDLYIVSVLLDAGAGPWWKFKEYERDWRTTGVSTSSSEEVVWEGGRSEGLAVASWVMFMDGVFSSHPEDKLRVDASALKSLAVEKLAKHLQVSESNPMEGLEGRCNLLIKLGSAIEARPDICKTGRPGDVLVYLQSHMSSPNILPMTQLWQTVFDLLLPIWPSRTTLPNYPTIPLGDIWPCPALERSLAGQQRTEGASLVPFHKLTQWLCYSIVEGIESEAGWTVEGKEAQTVLPEYRNGGLLVDLDVISLRGDSIPADAWPNGKNKPPLLAPSQPAIVEWRAITIGVLSRVHPLICKKLGVNLTLAQVIEVATWKGGREIAKTKRAGGGPPIDIISDGTVF